MDLPRWVGHMTMTLDSKALAQDGEWFAHRYDPQADAVHFMHVTRETHRKATFLTDEYLPAGLTMTVVKRQAVVDHMDPVKAPHFIFHSAFCCSTVLARAFDIPGLAMGLKEPPIFNDIVGWRHRGGGPPARVAQVIDHVTALLARPLSPGETMIIKPGNLANGFARSILAMRKQTKALLLYAPLNIYLRSIAKKEMTGRLWVRDLLVKLLKDGLVDLGFSTEDYLAQTDLQVAAVGWLAQQALFARLASEFGPDRVRTLDSETLLANPRAVMQALCIFYGLDLQPDRIDAIVAGPAFTTHSKHKTPFGADARITEYVQAESLHRDEIEKVFIWAEAVAANAGVPLNLSNRLLAGAHGAAE
jgi:hypothetical protein